MAPRRKPPAAPPEKKPKAGLAAFAKDFVADLPAETAGGDYAPTARDRWHDRRFDVADGTHTIGDWAFTFAGGLFRYARKHG